MDSNMFTIPNNPLVTLTGNYSFKVLRKLEDNWREWCYRRYIENHDGDDNPDFDESFPMDKKEWKRAKKLYLEGTERTRYPRSFNWENEGKIQAIANVMQDKHKKEKKAESEELEKQREWLEKKMEEDSKRKKTYAEAVKGKKDCWPLGYISTPMGSFVLMLTLAASVTPSGSNPIGEKWITTDTGLFRACSGIVFYRALDDTKFGYTDRTWNRCCREADKNMDPAKGSCEIKNSVDRDHIEKKLFDLYFNDRIMVKGRPCIEMVRICRDLEDSAVVQHYQANETIPEDEWEEEKDKVKEIVREEDKIQKNLEGEIKQEERTEKQEGGDVGFRSENVTKSGPIGNFWNEIGKVTWSKDECEGTPLSAVDIRTILNMEICLGHCEKDGKSLISLDQKWYNGLKRSECWEETKEEWLMEDEQQVWSHMLKKQNSKEIVLGGRSMSRCSFTDCKGKKPLSSFEIWVEDGHRKSIEICEECEKLRFPKECLVTVRGSNTDVVIDMLGDFGTYYIKIGDNHKEGSFLATKTETMEIYGPGSKMIIGFCNDRIIERKFVVTTNEYCNEKYKGMLEKFDQIYCKQHRTIKVLLVLLICLGAFYWGSDILGAVVGALFSLIFLSVTVFLTKKIICSICSKTTMFGVGHKCVPKTCIYCGCDILTERSLTDMNQDEIKTYIYEHQRRRCPKFVSSNLFVISLMNYFRLFCRFFTYLFQKAPAFMIFIILIWLASIVFQEADAFKLSDIMTNSTEVSTEKKNGKSKLIKMYKVDSCTLKYIFYNLVIPLLCVVIIVFRRALSAIYIKIMRATGKEPCSFCYQMRNKGDIEMAHSCKKLFCQTCKSLWGTSSYFDKDEAIRSITSEHDCFTGSRLEKAKNVYSDKVKVLSLKMIIYPSQLIMLITFVLILRCANGDHYTEMKKMESDLGDLIQELKREGFHPYSARFSGGLRETVSAVREVKECKSGTCKVQMEIEALLKVREGREYGFNVKNKNKYSNMKDIEYSHMNVKLSNLKTACEYKELYKTGPIKHKQYSGDTCTESCSKCQENLKEKSNEMEDKAEDVFEVNHENTASWGCDGPGCMAINQGCTCGRCYCTIEEEDVAVLEIVKEKQTFDLCIQLGGNGYCKTMEKETRDKKIFVINFEENLQRCPKLIALEKSGKILEGEMNKAGEFDNKFGSVQKIGKSTMSKREERYQEHCLFAKHRYMTFDQCCKDTYHMKKYMKKSSLIMSGKRFYKSEVDIGTWKINLLVPPMSYTEKEDSLKLENLKIEDCMGCHNCEEGGSCLLQYKSTHEATVPISCEPCTIDTDVIHLAKGIKSTPFNIFCKGEEIKLNCKVMGKEISSNFRLVKQPNKPHGDGYINMDREKFIHEECEGFLCGLKFPSLDLFGWFKWVLVVIILIFVFVLLVYAVKVLFLFFKKVKNQ